MWRLELKTTCIRACEDFPPLVQDAKQSRESQLWDMWTQPVTVRLNGDIEYAMDT